MDLHVELVHGRRIISMRRRLQLGLDSHLLQGSRVNWLDVFDRRYFCLDHARWWLSLGVRKCLNFLLNCLLSLGVVIDHI